MIILLYRASSGIGLELARLLYLDGFSLILISRSDIKTSRFTIQLYTLPLISFKFHSDRLMHPFMLVLNVSTHNIGCCTCHNEE